MSDFRIGYPKNEANPQAKPLPKQLQFHNSKAKYRLLAGGFGTGKTTSLIIETLYSLLNYPDNYGVLGRKDLGELKSTTLKEFFGLCPKNLIADHNKQDKTIRMINGSELYYMNLDDSREATEKIKSLNLGFVAIDQLEEIQESVFFAFQGRLRRQNSERNFYATCNPAGHDWLYRRWKTKEDLDETQKQHYELFESISTENIYLPADYVEQLLSYPKNWVNRFVFCSWDDFEGIVYNEFKEATHTFNSYEPQEGQQHLIVIDYGFRNPTAIGYACTDFDGVTRVYSEYYEAGKLISEIAAEIKRNKFYKKATILADPSIFNNQRDGKSVGDEFVENGIYCIPADNDVQQGINRVNQLFKDMRLLIGKACVNGIKEIGGYKWKAIKPGQERNEFEEPTKKDDHFCDLIRYLVNYIYKPIQQTDDRPEWLKKFEAKKKTQNVGVMAL